MQSSCISVTSSFRILVVKLTVTRADASNLIRQPVAVFVRVNRSLISSDCSCAALMIIPLDAVVCSCVSTTFSLPFCVRHALLRFCVSLFYTYFNIANHGLSNLFQRDGYKLRGFLKQFRPCEGFCRTSLTDN